MFALNIGGVDMQRDLIDEYKPQKEEKGKGDVKVRVIDSDKLIKAIEEGSYEINLSAVMALGAVNMLIDEGVKK
jgi:hypothetical protein